MTEAYPQQGEVDLVRALQAIGDTKQRPVAVVSINSRNELSRTVLIVPFTSDLRGGETPTRILIPAGVGGLESDSLAVCEQILAVQKTYLEQGPYGHISADFLARIQRAVQVSIGIYEL
ncbi:type II toxin-antitoxin system PemK/MazF family toxin [Microcoleus sp. F10-C6]|uniref:type II toxin-antitoxin system PemK/MazF family toxin n=1 Tax=unclassified Microcoleus TaxID=2642155 RepID=UPI002FD530F8